jgi:hypothetical protein
MTTLTATPPTAPRAVLGCSVDSDAIQAAVDRFAVGDCWEIACQPNGQRLAIWLVWSVDLDELAGLLADGDTDCVDFRAPDWDGWESADEADIPTGAGDFFFVRYLLSVD